MDSYIQIAITIINAAIMTWLGINQYKLQKLQTELQRRQTEAQEYEIYKRIYLLLVQTHTEVDDFMNNVSFGTWGTHHNIDPGLLKRKEHQINRLKENLLENYVDYELKFSAGLFDKDVYRRILSTMSSVYCHMNIAIEKDEVKMPIGSHHIYPVDGDIEKGEAVAIAGRFKDPEVIFHGLMSFIEQKRKLGTCDDALKTIKEKCKID